MSNESDAQVCEACGCAGEMGFFITEGDEVAEVTIFSQDPALLEAELAKYVEMAKQVNAAVEYETTEVNSDTIELTARFKFEVSVEKLIFELKTRSLAR